MFELVDRPGPRPIDVILERWPEAREPTLERLEDFGGNSASEYGQMAAFSGYVIDAIRRGDTAKVPEILEWIESLAASPDPELANAATTEFIENLINALSHDPELAARFVPYLGPKSREFVRKWDEFTGVHTPGL